jgi:hypothetical protein
MSNKRFTTIPHEFCITFDNYAEVQHVEEARTSGGYKGMGFNFHTIKDINEKTGLYMLDLIGIITEAQPSSQI